MIKIIKWLIFIALFIYIAQTNVGQSALTGIGSFFVGFYENGLVYANAEIYIIFAVFMFVMGYAVIKH